MARLCHPSHRVTLEACVFHSASLRLSDSLESSCHVPPMTISSLSPSLRPRPLTCFSRPLTCFSIRAATNKTDAVSSKQMASYHGSSLPLKLINFPCVVSKESLSICTESASTYSDPSRASMPYLVQYLPAAVFHSHRRLLQPHGMSKRLPHAGPHPSGRPPISKQ